MTPEQGGILDSNEPQLAAAHIVYAPYCSSDGWAGSASAAPPTGFAFRGHDIVEGIFRDLVTSRGLGAVPGTRVMYGGCSAGARGALFNLDHVALSLLPSIVSPFSNIERIGGLLDSAFWVDIPQLPSAHEPSFEDQARDVLALANASVSEASACRAAYPTEGWKCIYGQFAIPFVRSDFFLVRLSRNRCQSAAQALPRTCVFLSLRVLPPFPLPPTARFPVRPLPTTG